MAISTATRTSYDNVLREIYTPKLWELQNRDRIMLQIFNRNTRAYSEGKAVNVRLHIAGTGAVGWSNTGVLPVAGVQQYANAAINYYRLYGRFQLDGPVLLGTEAGYAADVRALEAEAVYLVEDLADALAYDIWQDGTAILGGQVGAHSTPAQGNFSIAKAGCGLRKNMIVDIQTSAGANGTDGGDDVLITSIVEHASDSTKYDVVTDIATGDGTWDDETYYVYRQGSLDHAIQGIQHIMSATSTYLGINRTTAANAFFRPQMMNNGGTNRECTPRLMQQMIDRIAKNSPGHVRLIVTTHDQWNLIAERLTADKRYGGDQYKLNDWCQAIDFAGIPIVREKYCPANKMYFFDTDTWWLYQDSEGGFIDNDGQILHWKVDYDAFEAAWRRYVQLVCLDPASNGELSDLSET